jgi:hypothetical protein
MAAYASLHGGFLGYGPRISALFRRAAWYVDKILHGVAPQRQPVAQNREEPKAASICNVVPVSGEWWKIKVE